MKCPSEHLEQRDFVSWFRKTYPDVLIFAVPNGGARGAAAAGRLKAEGVVRGVPDLFIPPWRLFIEMKRQQGGSLSPDQKAMIPYLESVGYRVLVCKGCDDAVEQLQSATTSNGHHSGNPLTARSELKKVSLLSQ